ncbi:MAG: tRNA 4-thiouridine(8) synthase ThiI [Ruminococcaceae bacterium]|nr:tRNA 4-thiouridine(8) synthase ThiI [Oscillospiraceae bacterium]
MKEILLCKYGEIVLKGANRRYFEDMLAKELRYRAVSFGNFSVRYAQSTVYIEPQDELCDLDGMFEAARRLFGIAGVVRAAVAEKNMESILATAKAYLPPFLAGKKTFKVEAKRSDKAFPLSSPEISAQTGGEILSMMPRLRVDVHHPDVTVRVEVRDTAAYVHAGQFKGAGGLPVGASGKGLLLLSGGIDSPVAGWMMAKRGVKLEALYFESMPYTSEQARGKVLDLAALVARWAGSMQVNVISLTHIQEELVKHCDEEYFTLLLRRFMMRLANRVAALRGCESLITGESLGQVASQTMQALHVTNSVAAYPVFRPCIGMDKEEIVQISRMIGTFETSILPYEDCCTVFTPKHPKTRPEPEKVEAQEQKLPYDELLEEAYASLETFYIRAKF